MISPWIILLAAVGALTVGTIIALILSYWAWVICLWWRRRRSRRRWKVKEGKVVYRGD